MAKPFEAVERLPVPPEVDAAFRKVSAAQQGSGRAMHARFGAGYGSAGRGALDRATKASEKLAAAEAEAAAHFGGDVAKMTVHHKRWVRWGKTAMSPAGLAEGVAGNIAKLSEEDGPRVLHEAMEGGRSIKMPRGPKPTRRKA